MVPALTAVMTVLIGVIMISIVQPILGVTPVLGPDATGVGHVFWYTLESETHSLTELRSLQDWFVRYQLNAVPGVAEVASVGGFVQQYQIDVDPIRLEAQGLRQRILDGLLP